MQGENYVVDKTVCATMHFNGTKIEVKDSNRGFIKVQLQHPYTKEDGETISEEIYSFSTPTMDYSNDGDWKLVNPNENSQENLR